MLVVTVRPNRARKPGEGVVPDGRLVGIGIGDTREAIVTLEVTPLLVVLVMFPPMSNAWICYSLGRPEDSYPLNAVVRARSSNANPS